MKKIFFLALALIVAFCCMAQAPAGTPPIRKVDIGTARLKAVISLPIRSSGGSGGAVTTAAMTPTVAPIRSTDPGSSGKTNQETLFTKPGANTQGLQNARLVPPSALPVRSGKDSLQKTGGH